MIKKLIHIYQVQTQFIYKKSSRKRFPRRCGNSWQEYKIQLINNTRADTNQDKVLVEHHMLVYIWNLNFGDHQD